MEVLNDAAIGPNMPVLGNLTANGIGDFEFKNPTHTNKYLNRLFYFIRKEKHSKNNRVNDIVNEKKNELIGYDQELWKDNVHAINLLLTNREGAIKYIQDMYGIIMTRNDVNRYREEFSLNFRDELEGYFRLLSNGISYYKYYNCRGIVTVDIYPFNEPLYRERSFQVIARKNYNNFMHVSRWEQHMDAFDYEFNGLALGDNVFRNYRLFVENHKDVIKQPYVHIEDFNRLSRLYHNNDIGGFNNLTANGDPEIDEVVLEEKRKREDVVRKKRAGKIMKDVADPFEREHLKGEAINYKGRSYYIPLDGGKSRRNRSYEKENFEIIEEFYYELKLKYFMQRRDMKLFNSMVIDARNHRNTAYKAHELEIAEHNEKIKKDHLIHYNKKETYKERGNPETLEEETTARKLYDITEDEMAALFKKPEKKWDKYTYERYVTTLLAVFLIDKHEERVRKTVKESRNIDLIKHHNDALDGILGYSWTKPSPHSFYNSMLSPVEFPSSNPKI
jgi:hypothetical protein